MDVWAKSLRSGFEHDVITELQEKYVLDSIQILLFYFFSLKVGKYLVV